MAGKEAELGVRRSWATARWTFVLGAVGVIAVVVAVRWTFGVGEAQAQNTIRLRPPGSAATPPAATPPAAPTAPVIRAANAEAPVAQPRPAAPAAPAAAPAAPNAEERAQLKVMAVVNGAPISRQELANECVRRYGQDVAEALINKHLILQECRRQNVVITEKDIEAEAARMAAKFNLPLDRWLELLQQERNVSRDQYYNDILWPTIALRRLARDRIDVTPSELKQAFEAEFGPKVRVRLITVSSRDKAEQLLRAARANPDDFGSLAKDHSEDPNSAAARGMIPPIRLHVGDPKVEQAAFALAEGQVSDILHVANQYLILKCEARLAPAIIPPEHRRHAEENLTDQIRDRKLREAGSELFRRLQEESQVVNVMNDPQLAQQLPGVAATINGAQLTLRQLGEECLTRHGQEVLEGEINRKILEGELQRRKLTVVQADIDAEVARAAEMFGYMKNGRPDVEAWLTKVTEEDGATVELYVRDAVWPSVALRKLVEDRVRVTPEDMQKGFEANFGERVEVLAIVLGDARQAQKVWQMARENPTNEFFGQLASQYSIEPASKANGGYVPPIRRHSGQETIEKEAFRLQPGELSSLVALGEQYVILRCIGRTQQVVTDPQQVEAELRRDLFDRNLRQAMADEFDRLHQAAQIDNFLAGTSQSGKRVAGPAPAAVPRAAANPAPTAPGRSAINLLK